MTVTYSLNVAKARLCGFAKLLVRWKGSIYKLLYREMIIFCGLYYSLSFIYRYLLQDNHRIVFEKLALYCEAFTKLIPLSFVLGFYVSIVVGRWWQQFLAIPWPDKSLGLIAAYVHGSDERGRMIRRTLARYLLLLQALTFKAISTAVRKRFPTEDHLVEAGIMTKEERIAYDEVPGTHGKYWVPAYWYTSLLVRARKEGRVKEDIYLKQMLDELHEYRGGCGMLFAYDWISIPLVYTQTVTIATYTYFLANVMGRQYLDPVKGYSGHDIDLYVPVFTILEFFFFIGWLKVAEQLINPFGEDDDDFELNWMLDRNWMVSVWVVDEMYNKFPRIVRDIYWDDVEPCLPYTKSSYQMRAQPYLGSAMRLDIDPEDSEFLPMATIMEEDTEENSYNSPPQSPTNELIGPNFPTGSLFNLPEKEKDIDTTSQSTLKFFSDLPGPTRLLNMLMGQSSEKVAQTSLEVMEAKEKGSMIAPFLLKSPKKKKRTTSSSSGGYLPSAHTSTHASLAASIDGLPEKPTVDFTSVPVTIPERLRTPGVRRKGVSTPDERRSLILDLDRSDTGSLNLKRRETVSVDESGRSFLFDPEDSRRIISEPTSAVGNRPRSRNSAVVLDVDKSVDTGRVSRASSHPSTPVPDEPQESPYEPNSSQESLSPYESNQSTVTSMTELLRKNKEFESA